MTRRFRRRALAATLLTVASLAAPAVAHADFGVSAFDGQVVANAAGDPYTQAGGHPFEIRTFIGFNTKPDAWGGQTPDENVRTIEVDLPAGLTGNPRSLPTCSEAQLSTWPTTCPTDSQVGYAVLNLALVGWVTVGIYNQEPPPGSPAAFGFNVSGGGIIHILPQVDAANDNRLRLDVRNIPQSLAIFSNEIVLWGNPADPAHDELRGGGFACQIAPPGDPNAICFGGGESAGVAPAAFLTLPTDCSAGPVRTTLRTTSWQRSSRWVEASFVSHLPPAHPAPPADWGPPQGVTGCDAVPFDPSVSVALGSTATDAPTGMTLDLGFPQDGTLAPGGIATAHLKHAKVTLPEGMTINPATARGLTACTNGQMGVGDGSPVRCPNASRIGNVWATTPLLQEPLGGGVYVASQLSGDPESGQMFRIFLQLESEARGVRVKLPGAIRVDRATGRIEATFRDNPQLPVSDLRVQFKGGPTAPLATPPTCGSGQFVAQLDSWAGQTAYRSSSVTFPCKGERGFAPSFTAGSMDATGGAFAPFTVRLGRDDGSQYLRDLRVELPTGVLAKLDGVPLCGDAAADAGACPGESRVGTATIGAGAGDPFFLQGGVYLTGPYQGAPFGLAVVTRAVAGPFDLGTVVVRQALHVDPRDAHVTIASDAFPQIVKGVPLRLRSIVVDMDRPGFMVNPTDCSAKEIKATIGSADGTSVNATTPFAAIGCDKLDVEPNLQLQLTDATQTRDGDHPGLVANLALDPGGANLRQVAVGLPLSLALDVNNAQALCTPEQAQAKDCPAGSIVGTATAVTPLLHEPLTGNVYFVEGRRTTETGAVRRTFPKLWVALRGAIALDVWADTDVDASQRLVTTFASIPDAPISRFTLSLAGGEHGILALNTNVCRGRQVATSAFDGHNGKRAEQTNELATPCAGAAAKATSKKAKKPKKGKGARRAARRAA